MIRIRSGGAGPGTVIEVDGQVLPHVRDASVRFSVDEVNRLSVEMLAFDGVDLEFEGRVEPTFVPLPGFRIVQEQRNGRVVVRTEPEGDVDEDVVARIQAFLGTRALRLRP